jgi:hypothetical protein
MSDLAPIDDRLYAKNRRSAATYCNWPDGALEECERLDAAHPGWHVGWLPANDITGWERPAGYCASLPGGPSLPSGDQLRKDNWERAPRVFAETPAELEERIAAMDARVEAHEAEQKALWASMRRGIC